MRHCFFSLTTFLIVFSVFAQADDSLAETFVMTVTADTRASIEYVVDGDTRYISIEAQAIESDTFDPVVWVTDSENRLVAYNDNFGENNTVKIDSLFLIPDTYTIWVDSFNGVSDGEVELNIQAIDPFNEAISSDENIITININLPEDTIYRHTIELSEDDRVSIQVRDTSNTLDPYLTILNEDEIELIANDDHQSMDLSLNRLDSLITEWQVPTDGNYIIEVRDFLGNSGEFDLTITINPD